ncbi:transglycosylase domain-containing protein [Aquihabitans sp. G128]|uniref:transglycosylase domain-containing protein n=1 Tax=Aquihabitans sp. G128 TaxID=2849779 RepID=UPI001C214286|nr:transglycosylase domain-containing protein [Aquihabitans sp. G128]QXC62357.1 transglycosylase domain-containing protein [Aquihabitans sp. G128]
MSVLKRFIRFVVVMAALIGVMAASLAVIGPQVANLVSAHKSDHQTLALKPLAERSYIFDASGSRLGTMTNREDPQNRVVISLKDIPDTVRWSVLATEDANFYKHKGVNIRSILRAVNANLETGGVSQGGSTITQQVVKNSLVGDQQDIKRKLREAFLAVELEKQMSKDEILEYYLNSVYFGGGAYGVAAASEYYFNKSVKDLNWAEGATLASLISSPNYYNPFKNPKVALKQRSLVFKRLVATKKLTEDEVKFYQAVPLPTVANKPKPPYDYFVEEVKQQLLSDPKYGLGGTEAERNRAVYEGGISVYTTYDPAMQEKAKQARDETMPGNLGDGTFQVINPKTGQPTIGTQAIASVEPSTGAVKVLLGGPGYDKVQFNIALAGRQVGSTMKAIVLATLLEQGYVPSDTVSGGKCTFKFPGQTKLYSPSTGKAGTGTITTMIQVSSNCGFVRLGQVAGIDNVVAMARKLGITSKLDAVPSLPLGTSDVSPLQMASAYATFANDGVRNEPYYIEKIVSRDGKTLYQHQAKPERVMSIQSARLVDQVLLNNVVRGTGKNAAIEGGQPAAGKTGTTNDSTDVWFVGFTPRLATAVWMGAKDGNISLDSNAELRGATGGKFPALTWGRYYSLLYAGLPVVDFTPADPTRSGKSVGKIPNEVGGSGGGSGTTRRTPRTNRGGGGGTGGTGATPTTLPGFTPTTQTPTTATPGTLGTVPAGGN